jgi:hypothetical protein
VDEANWGQTCLAAESRTKLPAEAKKRPRDLEATASTEHVERSRVTRWLHALDAVDRFIKPRLAPVRAGISATSAPMDWSARESHSGSLARR